jgi:hypothetical protein
MESKEMRMLAEQAMKGDPEAEHALGTRIEKNDGEEGDPHQKGSLGTIMGSLTIPKELALEHKSHSELYLVHFDSDPKGNLVFILGDKLNKVD